MCNLSFSRFWRLDCHIRAHIKEKPHFCDKCSTCFSSLGNLKRHKDVHDPNRERKFVCTLCKKTFLTQSNLRLHKKKHTGVKSYTCNLCEKSFFYKSSFIKHESYHAGDKPYICNICYTAFSLKGNLRQHMVTHARKQRYTCNICGVGFHSKGTLDIHRLQVHNAEKTDKQKPKSGICSICFVPFTYKGNMVQHLRTHYKPHRYKCDVCNIGFSSKLPFTKHNRHVHGVDTLSPQRPKTARRKALDEKNLIKPKSQRICNPIQFCEANLSDQEDSSISAAAANATSTLFEASLDLYCGISTGSVSPASTVECELPSEDGQAENNHEISTESDETEGIPTYACRFCGKEYEEQSFLVLHYIAVHDVSWASSDKKSNVWFPT